MTTNLSVAARNAMGDALESTIGTSPIMEIRTGAQPVNCAAADSGTVLSTLTLPSDWLSDAVAGVKSLLGTWEDTSADATGMAGHFRIKDSGGTVAHWQGAVATSGAELNLDNTSFAAGQPFSITSFSLTVGNA